MNEYQREFWIGKQEEKEEGNLKKMGRNGIRKRVMGKGLSEEDGTRGDSKCH